MAITLSPGVKKRIEDAVSTGRFASADAAVSFAFDALDQRERAEQCWREEVRRPVAEGVAALDRGDCAEFDDNSLRAFFDRIKSEGREQLARDRVL